MQTLTAIIEGFSWFAIVYFIVLNTWYLVLILLGAYGALSASRRLPFADYDRIFRSPLALPVSIIVPARNEQDTVVECVRSLLAVRYPEFEVIVVDDGSTDSTFDRLRRAFGLVERPRVVPGDIPLRGAIRSVHSPQGPENLVVIRKDSMGRPADAVNAGINLARHPLVCRVDADAYLDTYALLAVAKPFIEDPEKTVAVGAAVRAANGCVVREGVVVRPAMPAGWAAPIQAAEYLRAFLMGKAGWAQLQGMLFIAGVFGVFRRDVMVRIGGVDSWTDGDDVELVTRIHHALQQAGLTYRLPFVPEPCCWTQVPPSYRSVARQRRRWSNSLAQCLWSHRRMIFNPRYRFIGTVTLPHYLIFELLSAVVELIALVTFPLGLALGILNLPVVLLFLAVGLGYGTLLTFLSMFIETFWFHRYRTARDLLITIYAAIAENVGFRQCQAWWRLRGLADFTLGRPADWGAPPAPQEVYAADTSG